MTYFTYQKGKTVFWKRLSAAETEERSAEVAKEKGTFKISCWAVVPSFSNKHFAKYYHSADTIEELP